MQVEFKGRPPHYDYKLSGSVLTVGSYTLDLESLRGDTENVVDIRDEAGNFVANLILPPNEYELVDTGKTDEQGNPLYEKRLKPLNLSRVRLILWSKVEVPQGGTPQNPDQNQNL